jgi:hypothetical protein
MPTRTFISKEEKSMLEHKVTKNWYMLLVSVNAVGDFKLKPF